MAKGQKDKQENKKPQDTKYWASPTMIRGIGCVAGKAKAKDIAVFKSYSTASIDKYLINYDPVAKKLAENRKKFKDKLGISE